MPSSSSVASRDRPSVKFASGCTSARRRPSIRNVRVSEPLATLWHVPATAGWPSQPWAARFDGQRSSSSLKLSGSPEASVSIALGRPAVGCPKSRQTIRFARCFGSVESDSVKRQETQIVQSCMTLDDLLLRFWPTSSFGGRALTSGLDHRLAGRARQIRLRAHHAGPRRVLVALEEVRGRNPNAENSRCFPCPEVRRLAWEPRWRKDGGTEPNGSRDRSRSAAGAGTR